MSTKLDCDKSPLIWTMSSYFLHISFSVKIWEVEKKKSFKYFSCLNFYLSSSHFSVQRDDVGITLLAGSGL